MPNTIQNRIADKNLVMSASAIHLDNSGNVPVRLPVLTSGNWPNSVKGDFAISTDDLKQIKINFDKGIGFPTEDASTGLAIDFMHNYDEEAAGWIKGLELQIDRNDESKATLYANPVEWTDSGKKAVEGGQFKMISPSGYFGTKNGKQMSLWSNPNNLDEKVANVLDGAGLTNIPFLRNMSPVRADKIDDGNNGYANIIYVEQEQHKKEPSMNLDSLRVKTPDELSGSEYKFVIENKDQLSTTELKTFGLEAAVENKEEVSDEDKALLAAVKSGDKKVVDKEELSADSVKLAALEKVALDYKTEKAEAIVASHVKRGAIKQDANEFWTKQLLSVDGENRSALETQLAGLPSNETLSKEIGTSEDTAAGSTARESLDIQARAKVDAAAKEGKTLLYGDALKEAIRDNKDLAEQDRKEQLVGAN